MLHLAMLPGRTGGAADLRHYTRQGAGSAEYVGRLLSICE